MERMANFYSMTILPAMIAKTLKPHFLLDLPHLKPKKIKKIWCTFHKRTAMKNSNPKNNRKEKVKRINKK